MAHSARRYLHADERGSITAVTDFSGNALWANTYDEYGIPGASNDGRFQYTGQAWIEELGMYYYKARMYSPTLGRFMQTDPIGYGDGMNIYAYVGSDPINGGDPTGRCVIGHGPELGGVGWDFSGCMNDFPDIRFLPFGGFGGSGAAPMVTPPGPYTCAANAGQLGVNSRTCVDYASFDPIPEPEGDPCDAPLTSTVGSARAVLETVALGADIATVGFVAAGITAPAAVATKLVGYGAEAGLLGVNLYDGFANGNWGELQAQASGAATRLIPGGRTLQLGLRAARGPTGILRNSRGQFRSSHINNPGVERAGNLAIEEGTKTAVGAVACK